MAYKKPTYYYKNQTVYIFGSDDHFDYEKATVLEGSAIGVTTVKIKDANGTEVVIDKKFLMVEDDSHLYGNHGYLYNRNTYNIPQKITDPATNYKEFTASEQKFVSLLKTVGHTNVVNAVLDGIDLDQFDRFDGTMWTLLVPKNTTGSLPFLMAHTDTILKQPTDDTLEFDPKTRKLYCTTGLGADDRAGCWVIHETLKKHPTKFGFILFDLEESGCQGSGQFVTTKEFEAIDTIASAYISIDRKRGTNGAKTIATYGYNSSQLNSLVTAVTKRTVVQGSSTDCRKLSSVSKTKVPCFNFSCGYDREHTVFEHCYIDETAEVTSDISALVSGAPQLWSTKFTVDPIKATTTYSNTKSKNKSVVDFDEFVIVDGELFGPDDVEVLLWHFRQTTGVDYSFNTAQLYTKEYAIGNFVRLDKEKAVGGYYGGKHLDIANYNKLKLHNWKVTKVDDVKMLLNLVSATDIKVVAENIPFDMVEVIRKSDLYVG